MNTQGSEVHREVNAAQAGTVVLGDVPISRIGLGTIRLPGPGSWGYPDDAEEMRRLLRRAVELGVNYLDTAAYYGPLVSDRLIVEALYPYPAGLLIGTKVGGWRGSDRRWTGESHPRQLKGAVSVSAFTRWNGPGKIEPTETQLTVEVISTTPQACCPECGQASDVVHCQYQRTVHNVPCGGRKVVLRLKENNSHQSGDKTAPRSVKWEAERARFRSKDTHSLPGCQATGRAVGILHYQVGECLSSLYANVCKMSVRVSIL